jgi:hypothetical protein
MRPNFKEFLNFNSPNKADYLIVQKKWDIPFHAQNFIRENINAPEAQDLLPFFHKAYNDFTFDKRDKKFVNAKAYYSRIKNRGTECYNFTDDQILFIVSFSRSKQAIDILKEMFPDERDYQKLNGICHWVKELQKVWGLEYLGPAEVYEDVEEVEEWGGHYVSPKTDETILYKINQYCPGANWLKYKLDSFQKKCIKVLKGLIKEI